MPSMDRTPSPITSRPCVASPAISEISVGSPSPPPPPLLGPRTHFQPLNIKRLRLLHASPMPAETHNEPVPQPGQRSQTSRGERIKSFSIADILGKRDDPPAPVPLTDKLTAMPAAPPAPQHPMNSAWSPAVRLVAAPLHPFISPALLHNYEQRLAWDYQRQLQEHFQAQAQLLRQMSLDPNIIPSEDGSERSRSRSSSTGSDCCSPEVVCVSDQASKASDTGKDASKSVAEHDLQQQQSHNQRQKRESAGDTPLDALFQLSTKNFDEEQDAATLNIFATRANPKKKRKSRTAFTNHQIFELEKRFLYQKYLSPADRDEIALGLSLSNAQVITWFQNRRAKLKRDMEELKKDVDTVNQLHDPWSADSNSSRSAAQQKRVQHMMQAHNLSHSARLQQHIMTSHHTCSASTTALSLTSPSARHNNLSSSSSSSHNNADKQELRLLKMMTLMHYSSGAVSVGGSRENGIILTTTPPHAAT